MTAGRCTTVRQHADVRNTVSSPPSDSQPVTWASRQTLDGSDRSRTSRSPSPALLPSDRCRKGTRGLWLGLLGDNGRIGKTRGRVGDSRRRASRSAGRPPSKQLNQAASPARRGAAQRGGRQSTRQTRDIKMTSSDYCGQSVGADLIVRPRCSRRDALLFHWPHRAGAGARRTNQGQLSRQPSRSHR